MRVGTQSGTHGAKKGAGVGGNGHDDIVGDESIVTKVHAVGIIGGATPLLTGTLTGHPSNRTIYSG